MNDVMGQIGAGFVHGPMLAVVQECEAIFAAMLAGQRITPDMIATAKLRAEMVLETFHRRPTTSTAYSSNPAAPAPMTRPASPVHSRPSAPQPDDEDPADQPVVTVRPTALPRTEAEAAALAMAEVQGRPATTASQGTNKRPKPAAPPPEDDPRHGIVFQTSHGQVACKVERNPQGKALVTLTLDGDQCSFAVSDVNKVKTRDRLVNTIADVLEMDGPEDARPQGDMLAAMREIAAEAF